MTYSEEESMDFFQAFDFTPRNPCPFCGVKMKVYRLSSGDMFSEHRASHSCESEACKVSPSSRFTICLDETHNEFLSVTMVVQVNDTYYRLFCMKESNETWIEKLIPDGVGNMWVPKPVIEIQSYIKFNPDSPIESGLEIVNRLLDLKLFY